LFAGEGRSYPLIARRDVIVGSGFEAFPMLALVKASRDDTELSKRTRQLGITHVLHNPTSAAFGRRMARRYPWSEREAALWTSFWRTRARPVSLGSRLDSTYGWYALYALGPPRAGGDLPAVPGVEALVSPLEDAFNRRDYAAWNRGADDLDRRFAGVAFFDFTVADIRLAQGRLPEAERLLARARRTGFMTPGLHEDLLAVELARRDHRSAVRTARALARRYWPPAVPGAMRELLRRAALPAEARSFAEVPAADLEELRAFAGRVAVGAGDAELARLCESVRPSRPPAP
ncbi:MAG: hypothetical protein AAB368_01925, partial [bacterium]